MAKRGRPKGSKNSTYLNNQKLREDIETVFKCTCCGKIYKGATAQSRNFRFSQSKMYESNNHRVTICNNCVDIMYADFIEKTHDAKEALRRVAMLLDLYCDDTILNIVETCRSDMSVVGQVTKQLSLSQYKGKTYMDYLDDGGGIIENKRDVERQNVLAKIEAAKEVNEKALTRWGFGFSSEELEELEKHYSELLSLIDKDNLTVIVDNGLKDACKQHIYKIRSFGKNISDYEKACKLYQQTLEKIGIANIKKKNEDTEKYSLGQLLDIIERYSPAEYYADKQIFADFDKFDDYEKRFIQRPKNNILNGTNIKDEEYSIKEEDE